MHSVGEKQGSLPGLLRLLEMVFGAGYKWVKPQGMWKEASSCVMTLNWGGRVGQVMYR